MISIGQIPFIIIIQTIIFLILLVLFLFFLLRSKNKKLASLNFTENNHDEASAKASIEHYLTAEIKLTKSRFDSSYKDEEIKSEVIAEPDWLRLRENYLAIEKELLAINKRENSFWIDTGEKLKKLLSNSYLVKRIMIKEVNAEDEEDLKAVKLLLKSQNEDFNDLASMLVGEKNTAEVAELKQKLMKISRSHTELSQCIFILEDENLFLRDQIASLLK